MTVNKARMMTRKEQDAYENNIGKRHLRDCFSSPEGQIKFKRITPGGVMQLKYGKIGEAFGRNRHFVELRSFYLHFPPSWPIVVSLPPNSHVGGIVSFPAKKRKKK